MKKGYYHLDDFLLMKMLGCKKDHNVFSEEERYQAYRMFLKLTGENGKRIAATQTIQKWFGIGGQKRPNREGLFKLGFALKLSDKEMRELLVYVTCEPDFQVNDYREMIYMYGFYHHLSYVQCLEIIEKFEKSIPYEFSLKQKNCTNNIWKEYGKNCELGCWNV